MYTRNGCRIFSGMYQGRTAVWKFYSSFERTTKRLRCSYFFRFFSSPLLYSPFFFLSLLIVIQIRGHTAGSFSPPCWGIYVKNIDIMLRRKGSDMQTNRKLSVTNTAQNGQHGKWIEAAQEIGMYLALYSGKKCEKSQPCSGVVVMKTAAELCVCWRSTVHSVISPAEKYHNCLPRGPIRSISLRFSVVSSHATCGFCETSENKKI